jgi:hypothetical protein
MTTLDLVALDRLIGRASFALLDGSLDLLGGVYREAAKQSTFDALRSVAPALAAHVAHLTIARVAGGDFDEAMKEPSVSTDLPRVATSERTASLEGALLEMVAASSVETAREWLSIASKAATTPADAARKHAEIAGEAARRLSVVPDAALANEADSFLDRTSDLARSIAIEPAAMLRAASAQEAGDGWPRRATVQFVIEAFGADLKARRTIERIADRARTRKEQRLVIGASSHVRAIAGFAFDWHARMPGEGPFTKRHDPQWTGAHGSALLVASALATMPFQKRSLGTSERIARAQARTLDVSGLLTARMAAARILEADLERGERLFGRPIHAALNRVLPRPRRDASGRFRAWLDLPALLQGAQSTHDEDWFRNPRFWEEMTIRFASPSASASAPPSAAALASIFVERLA